MEEVKEIVISKINEFVKKDENRMEIEKPDYRDLQEEFLNKIKIVEEKANSFIQLQKRMEVLEKNNEERIESLTEKVRELEL